MASRRGFRPSAGAPTGRPGRSLLLTGVRKAEGEPPVRRGFRNRPLLHGPASQVRAGKERDSGGRRRRRPPFAFASRAERGRLLDLEQARADSRRSGNGGADVFTQAEPLAARPKARGRRVRPVADRRRDDDRRRRRERRRAPCRRPDRRPCPLRQPLPEPERRRSPATSSPRRRGSAAWSKARSRPATVVIEASGRVDRRRRL